MSSPARRRPPEAPGAHDHLPLAGASRAGTDRGQPCSAGSRRARRPPHRRRTRVGRYTSPLPPGAAAPRRSRNRRNSTPEEARSRVPRRRESLEQRRQHVRGVTKFAFLAPRFCRSSSSAASCSAWGAPLRPFQGELPGSQLWQARLHRRSAPRRRAPAGALAMVGSQLPRARARRPPQTPPAHGSGRRRRGGRRDRSRRNAHGLRGATEQLARREPQHRLHLPAAHQKGAARDAEILPVQCEDASRRARALRSPRSSTSATRRLGSVGSGPDDALQRFLRHGSAHIQPARQVHPSPWSQLTAMEHHRLHRSLGGRVVANAPARALPGGAAMKTTLRSRAEHSRTR